MNPIASKIIATNQITISPRGIAVAQAITDQLKADVYLRQMMTGTVMPVEDLPAKLHPKLFADHKELRRHVSGGFDRIRSGFLNEQPIQKMSHTDGNAAIDISYNREVWRKSVDIAVGLAETDDRASDFIAGLMTYLADSRPIKRGLMGSAYRNDFDSISKRLLDVKPRGVKIKVWKAYVERCVKKWVVICGLTKNDFDVLNTQFPHSDTYWAILAKMIQEKISMIEHSYPMPILETDLLRILVSYPVDRQLDQDQEFSDDELIERAKEAAKIYAGNHHLPVVQDLSARIADHVASLEVLGSVQGYFAAKNIVESIASVRRLCLRHKIPDDSTLLVLKICFETFAASEMDSQSLAEKLLEAYDQVRCRGKAMQLSQQNIEQLGHFGLKNIILGSDDADQFIDVFKRVVDQAKPGILRYDQEIPVKVLSAVEDVYFNEFDFQTISSAQLENDLSSDEATERAKIAAKNFALNHELQEVQDVAGSITRNIPHLRVKGSINGYLAARQMVAAIVVVKNIGEDIGLPTHLIKCLIRICIDKYCLDKTKAKKLAKSLIQAYGRAIKRAERLGFPKDVAHDLGYYCLKNGVLGKEGADHVVRDLNLVLARVRRFCHENGLADPKRYALAVGEAYIKRNLPRHKKFELDRSYLRASLVVFQKFQSDERPYVRALAYFAVTGSLIKDVFENEPAQKFAESSLAGALEVYRIGIERGFDLEEVEKQTDAFVRRGIVNKSAGRDFGYRYFKVESSLD